MIHLYYDKKLRIPAKVYHTFPLLEVLEKENSPLTPYYSIVDELETCDFAIVPISIEVLILNGKKTHLFDFLEECKRRGKLLLIFSGGDYGISMEDPNIFTVRLGGFHSKLNNRSFIMPPFIDDPYKLLNKEFTARIKPEKPNIGFVGHANGSKIKYIKEFGLHLQGKWNRFIGKDVTDPQFFYPSSIKRYTYLTRLMLQIDLITNFIFRDKYRAGVKTEMNKAETTQQFYENINENLYTFCLRGTGNFSVRFYETLAMGRIPVLVDTDCRLPFSDVINWKKQCVMVSEKDVRMLGDRVIRFHSGISENRTLEIQQENRKIWSDFFRKSTYFIKLAENLNKLKTVSI